VKRIAGPAAATTVANDIAENFRPIFHNQDPEKGMGLGLATVLCVVRHACGYVCAESQPGQGSVSSVYLPAAPESVQRQQEDRAALEDLRGTESILLVEDQDPLRESLCEILQELGYTVLEAEDADRAEQIACCHKDISLVLIDIAPPSGFVNHGPRHEGSDFIQKPFAPQVVAQKLVQLLDGVS